MEVWIKNKKSEIHNQQENQAIKLNTLEKNLQKVLQPDNELKKDVNQLKKQLEKYKKSSDEDSVNNLLIWEDIQKSIQRKGE